MACEGRRGVTSGRYILPAFFAAATFYFLYLVRGVLLPFVLAAALAYLLSPAVNFFVVHGLRRSTVVVMLYLSMLCGFMGTIYIATSLFSQEAARAALKMPEYVRQGQAYVDRLEAMSRPWRSVSATEHASGTAAPPWMAFAAQHMDIVRPILARAKTWPTEILRNMPSFASHLLPLLELAFLVPFIAFFLMMEGPRLIDGIFDFIPARWVEMSLNLLVELDNSLGNYLRGLSLEAVAVGLTALAGFTLIDLDYAIQIATIMALGNLAPYVGPILGSIIGGSVALFQWGSPWGVVKVVLVCAGVRFLEDWIYQPVIMKRTVHLHPVIVLFSLMAGASLWGVWGLFFGVPMACMVKVLFQVGLAWYRSEYGNRYDATPSEVAHIPLI